MDPKACLRRFIEATSRDELREARRDYNAWVERGGVPACVLIILGIYRGERGVVTTIRPGSNIVCVKLGSGGTAALYGNEIEVEG